MRILLLHDIGTPTGGAETQMLALRDGLRARGHTVELLSSDVRHPSGAAIAADATCFGTDSRLQTLSRTANPSAFLAVREALRSFQPDVVHVRLFLWQLSPLILPLLRDTPALYHAAMYASTCPKGTKRLPDGRACPYPAGRACTQNGCITPQTGLVLAAQRALWRRWRDALDTTVVLSERMRDVFAGDPNAPPTPMEVIYNGVPTRPARPALTSPPTAAYAGRLVPEKGVDVLLRAVAQAVETVPETQLLIAGQGPEEAALRQLADALAISERITWLGHLSRDDMERAFETAWVQAVPSQWDEPFGNVTTEAMMRGSAVVVSDGGAQPEIVGPVGRVVPRADVDAWATALIDVLSDRDAAERRGAEGRARAQTEFSEARCLDHFEALYARLTTPEPTLVSD
ncbi:MAG: glycosyltransferase [Rubricoccaceae bacterium]